jgi:hypothetical protein
MVMELLLPPGDPDPNLGHAPGQKEDRETVRPIPQSEERGLTHAQLRRTSQGQIQAQGTGQGQDHSCDY